MWSLRERLYLVGGNEYLYSNYRKNGGSLRNLKLQQIEVELP